MKPIAKVVRMRSLEHLDREFKLRQSEIGSIKMSGYFYGSGEYAVHHKRRIDALRRECTVILARVRELKGRR